jgi:hypothetical protein
MGQRELGPVVFLPSGRLGRQISVNRSDRPVFIDCDGKSCCSHGERAPSVLAWLSQEKLNPHFQRPSVCDCGNVDGLMTTYDIKESDRPTLEGSLFKFLGTMGSEEKVMNTRPQRLALKTPSCELWVQPVGTIVCEHGNSRKVLNRMINDAARFKRKGVVKCNCKMQLPRRIGSVFCGGKASECRTTRLPE